MAITEAQRQFRSHRLGSSDASRVMAGDWLSLWREKTGRTDRPMLDFVPAVQIGIATEHLHARFYTRHTGIACYPADTESWVHPEHDFLVAHLDFLTWQDRFGLHTGRPDTVLEAKFCASPQTDEELAERYYWQLLHQMMVAGFGRSVLSILRPSGYSCIEVPFDAERAAELLETERAFWWHVEQDMPPGDPLPVTPPPFETLKVVDMSFHNAFAAHAGTLAARRPDVVAYREAERELKALMPDDARIAYVPAADGLSGVYLSRSKDGKLSLKFGSVPKKHVAAAEPWMPDWLAEAAE